jgi:hypothetical protein
MSCLELDQSVYYPFDSTQITTHGTDLDLAVYTFPQLDSLVNLVQR